ncbi:hypothetical protein AB0O58_03260 [Rhodococcus sp. NPDC080181]|uniref:hypothetical protein n=1 Tax=Rhodococcus sp. NPDC080181 TaxID=3155292 RepID=UPI00344CBC1A
MTWRWTVGLMLVAITAVTCASPASLNPHRVVAEIGSAEAFRCDRGPQIDEPRPRFPRPTPGTVPDDFVPVAAIVCDQIDEGVAPDTVPYREHRYEGDLTEVIRLLNAPSESTLIRGYCPTYSVVEPPQIWLVDNRGRAMEPTLPTGECGLLNYSAIAEIRALDMVTEFEHDVSVISYDRQRVSSCSPHYSEVLLGSERAAGLTIGYTYCLFSGTEFTGVTGEIGISIEDLAPAGPCTMSATRTAVTTYAAGWPSNIRNFTIELDGCRRAIPDGYAPLQATDELLAAFW